MKICKVKDCNKKSYGRGWCQMHYTRWWKWDNPHYIHQRVYKKKYSKCRIKNCKEPLYRSGYCGSHYYKVRIYKNPFEPRHKSPGRNIKGKLNPNWAGGIAEYPNHAFMKKQRLIILINNPKCEICGEPATEIHHRNGNKADHRLINLMASCRSCNASIRFKPNNSKFRRLCGYTIAELAKKYHISYGTIYYRIKNDIPFNLSKYQRAKKVEV